MGDEDPQANGGTGIKSKIIAYFETASWTQFRSPIFPYIDVRLYVVSSNPQITAVRNASLPIDCAVQVLAQKNIGQHLQDKFAVGDDNITLEKVCPSCFTGPWFDV